MTNTTETATCFNVFSNGRWRGAAGTPHATRRLCEPLPAVARLTANRKQQTQKRAQIAKQIAIQKHVATRDLSISLPACHPLLFLCAPIAPLQI